MLATPLALGFRRDIDQLLDTVCVTLQIAPAQFDRAKEQYQAVSEWLAAPASSLQPLRPEIYPQGSMASRRTTVKPRASDEFDVDLVLELQAPTADPMSLYGAVERRLREHSEYCARIERKRRCLRLNCASDFHLDVLPARPDVRLGGTCIEVPDRRLEAWKPSNPKGYAMWFEGRCETGPSALAKRKHVPLPEPLPEHLTRALRRGMQLLKRRRDILFKDTALAPR